MRRLIFLDFDGVLNTDGHWVRVVRRNKGRRISPELFDPYKVELVNQIAEKGDARVVISSMWREWNPLHAIAECLMLSGARFHVVDQTPILNDRGRDIQGYLSQLWSLGFSPNYVILDDIDVGTSFGERFVRTNPKKGLTAEDASRAISVLLGA